MSWFGLMDDVRNQKGGKNLRHVPEDQIKISKKVDIHNLNNGDVSRNSKYGAKKQFGKPRSYNDSDSDDDDAPPPPGPPSAPSFTIKRTAPVRSGGGGGQASRGDLFKEINKGGFKLKKVKTKQPLSPKSMYKMQQNKKSSGKPTNPLMAQLQNAKLRKTGGSNRFQGSRGRSSNFNKQNSPNIRKPVQHRPSGRQNYGGNRQNNSLQREMRQKEEERKKRERERKEREEKNRRQEREKRERERKEREERNQRQQRERERREREERNQRQQREREKRKREDLERKRMMEKEKRERQKKMERERKDARKPVRSNFSGSNFATPQEQERRRREEKNNIREKQRLEREQQKRDEEKRQNEKKRRLQEQDRKRREEQERMRKKREERENQNRRDDEKRRRELEAKKREQDKKRREEQSRRNSGNNIQRRSEPKVTPYQPKRNVNRPSNSRPIQNKRNFSSQSRVTRSKPKSKFVAPKGKGSANFNEKDLRDLKMMASMGDIHKIMEETRRDIKQGKYGDRRRR